ncbi:hypothetical protein ACH5RR_020615 [Cinchona calisaya]|uniref:Protein kinase domain-containing protein n=1 Tax=Cinchona calisaya TaxID=153742 RepID=A0ABD2ZF16_9GENT
MAAALECWSSRASISADDDMVEQVLMRTHDRSVASPENTNSDSKTNGGIKESSVMQKRLQKLSRNVCEAIASLKNSLNLDSARQPAFSAQSGGPENCRKQIWGNVVRNLTRVYPGSQLPEKLVTNLRKHYDSLPISYAQVGFQMKDVFLHMKLIEQATKEDHPSIMIQEVSDDEINGSVFKLIFACNSSISWPSMSGALDSTSICCKKIRIFERKDFTLGIVMLLVQSGMEKLFKIRVENALKLSLKKPKGTSMKLPFRLCGCQKENSRGREFGEIDEDCGEQDFRNEIENSCSKVQLKMPLPKSSIVVSVDEWQTVKSGGNEIRKWLLNADSLEFINQIRPNSFRGVYKGKRVWIEKLKGCGKGNAYEFQLREDLLEIKTCGHKKILQFYGICIHENQGLCVVTKLMEGGSVQDMILKKKKLQMKEIMRIATDVAEGIKFMNDHGITYRDLNTQRILLDKQGNACLGDMGIVTVCKSAGEATEYETDGYRWLAPEIIASDPECVTETWMSNVYSFGMVLWEMAAGEIAYSAYSPVQAAVGIAACGLRPDIPKDCPKILYTLMMKCWNNSPSKRPQFSEILSTFIHPVNNCDNNVG